MWGKDSRGEGFIGDWVGYCGFWAFCWYSDEGEKPLGERRSCEERLVMLLAPTDKAPDEAYDPFRRPIDEADEKELGGCA